MRFQIRLRFSIDSLLPMSCLSRKILTRLISLTKAGNFQSIIESDEADRFKVE